MKNSDSVDSNKNMRINREIKEDRYNWAKKERKIRKL